MSDEIDDEKKLPTGTPIRELRIQHIEKLMRECAFETGVTYLQLAEQWGLKPQTIRKDTAEAHRRVKEAVMDHNTVNSIVGIYLEKTLKEAYKAEKWQLIAKICETWAKVSGAGAAEKVELTAKDASPESAAALVRQKFGEHATQRDSGEASPDPGDIPEGSDEE